MEKIYTHTSRPFIHHRSQSQWIKSTQNNRTIIRLRKFSHIVASCGLENNSGNINFRDGGRGNSGVLTFTHSSSIKDQNKFSFWDSRKLKENLASAGLSGIASYGICNTLYYSIAFIVVWFTVANVERGQGFAYASTAALKTLAITWAGSQITKVPRAAAALVLSPAVDRFLGWIRSTFKMKNKRNAFVLVVVPACWLLIASILALSVLLWM